MNPAEKTVQANLEAYNQRDLEGFMAYFSDDIQLVNFDSQETSATGKAQIRAMYKNLFDNSPKLHSEILKRIVFDNKVIDHEYITGRMGEDQALQLVLIYEVREEKIYKISVMRKRP